MPTPKVKDDPFSIDDIYHHSPNAQGYPFNVALLNLLAPAFRKEKDYYHYNGQPVLTDFTISFTSAARCCAWHSCGFAEVYQKGIKERIAVISPEAGIWMLEQGYNYHREDKES